MKLLLLVAVVALFTYRAAASPDGATGWISFVALWIFTVALVAVLVIERVRARD